MKKIITAILILCLFMTGCHGEESPKTVTFYYPRGSYSQNSIDSVLAPETRERGNLSSVMHLLDLYCQGPSDPTLTNPIPEGTSVVSVHVTGNVTIVTLTDAFAELTGLELVIACAGFHRTISALTGTPIVQIGCQSVKLDGKNHITIDSDTLLYIDTVPTETEIITTEE